MNQLHIHALAASRPAGGGRRRHARARPETDWDNAGRGDAPPLNVAMWRKMLEHAERQWDNCDAEEETAEGVGPAASSSSTASNTSHAAAIGTFSAGSAQSSPRTADVHVLSLSFNALEHVSWLSAKRFPRLRVLDVSHNGLTTLDGLESVASTLEVLRCNDNMISQLPSADAWKASPFNILREMWISRNRLKDVVSSFRSLQALPALACLVAYKNPWSQSLSPTQVRSLAEAHLSSLALFDGKRVTVKDRQRARAYWFESELGRNILSEMAPKVVERRIKTRAEMHSSESSRPWRRGMKKKKTQKKRRRQANNGIAQSLPGTKSYDASTTVADAAAMLPSYEVPPTLASVRSATGGGSSSESFGLSDILRTEGGGPGGGGGDRIGRVLPAPTTPPRPALSGAVPAQSPRVRLSGVSAAEPGNASAATTVETDGADPKVKPTSPAEDRLEHLHKRKQIAFGVDGGITQAMSMLPDLSSRLKRAGGGRRVRQESRRAMHKQAISCTNRKDIIQKKADDAANAAVRDRQRKKSSQKRHWSNPPPRKFDKSGSSKSSRRGARGKSRNQNPPSSADSDSVPPLIAQARALARMADAISNSATETRQETQPTLDGAVEHAAEGKADEEDDGMSALRAAKRLAAAATAAANQMGQMAAAASSASSSTSISALPATAIAKNKTGPPTAPNQKASLKSMYEKKAFYKGGVLATIVRKDGSAQARWPNTQLAVSIDKEGDGYRTFVQRPGTKHAMAISLDPQGRGSINRLSGKTLININGSSGGQLLDKSGQVLKRWDGAGNVTDASGAPCKFGSNGNNYVDIKLEEKGRLLARVSMGMRGFQLSVRFRCKGIDQTFNHGQNTIEL